MSGYTPCACRDCMDTTVSSDMSNPELCAECRKAGCPSLPERATYPNSGYWACQRDDAYGSGDSSWPCMSCTTECYCTADHDADADCVYCDVNAEVHCA